MTKTFFEEQSEESRIKAEIVEKYFYAWSRVIAKNVREKTIAYIDLFAGPGRYKDGSASVPVMIVQRAINDDFLRENLATIFNDKDENNSRTLEEEIFSIPGVEKLRHRPVIYNHEVGSEVVQQFESVRLAPTFFFIDPWGYKGLSLRLINSVLRHWGCDCIFFLNYNRVNMGINNNFVQQHMEALFGEERAVALRAVLDPLTPEQRELAVVDAVSEALRGMGGNYPLPFCFRNEAGTRTSHYLIFVSKNVTGYSIMKDIMANASTKKEQGVASFSYCRADKTMPFLFELSRPLEELEDMLLDEFAGQTLTMEQVYQRHQVGRPFVRKNYRDVLISLESKGRVAANPSVRRKGTFGPSVAVTFPGRRN